MTAKVVSFWKKKIILVHLSHSRSLHEKEKKNVKKKSGDDVNGKKNLLDVWIGKKRTGTEMSNGTILKIQ